MDENQIKPLLLQDRKIQDIRLVMQQTERGLREDNDYVEGLRKELFPRYANVRNVSDKPKTCMIDKASQLITQGRKLDAMQLLHHTTEMTLKETKDYIDRLDAEKLMP